MTSIKHTFLFSIVTFGMLCALAPDADAGCRINYSFQNNSDNWMAVGGLVVKSRGGKWKNVIPYARSSWRTIQANAKPEFIYKATFGCKAKRRWRFDVHAQNGCNKNIYYPSATGWTTSTDIDFGDISRHCR